VLCVQGCKAPPSAGNGGGGGGGGGPIVTVDIGPGLLDPQSVTYEGAVRVPDLWDANNPNRTFSYGGEGVAFNPAGNNGAGSIYISGHIYGHLLSELTFPTPVASSQLGDLPVASVIQPFNEFTKGKINQMPNSRIGGLLYSNGQLLWTLYKYYNVDAEHLPSHGASLASFVPGAAYGLWSLEEEDSGDTIHIQRTAGHLAEVPTSIVSHFGAPILSGAGSRAGMATANWGPSTFAFQPRESGGFASANAVLPARTLLGFDMAHRFHYSIPGATDAAKQTSAGPHEWVAADDIDGMGVVVKADGSEIAFVVVANLSTQTPHYAYGLPEDYPKSCFNSKGNHGWGYHVVLLYFKISDLLAVADGTMQPSEPVPYAQKDITSHFLDRSANGCALVSSATFSASTGKFYILEECADNGGGYSCNPVVHVFKVF
jgi:hypothetical protein